MINTKDQEQLFKLIASYLKKDITCYAVGGTAMMFYGYKNTTKDIDLVFETKEDLDCFIEAIKELGYVEKSIKEVYGENKLRFKNKPKMFSRGEERFDLFLNEIFGFKFSKRFKDYVKQRRDFIDKKELIINILPEEYLIILKSVTDREKDFEDIFEIVKQKKDINWDLVTDEAIEQRKNNEWILIDLEEKMQQLKKIVLIKEKYFKKLYKAQP